MTSSRQHLISFILLVILVALASCAKAPAEYKETRYIFGTLVEFIIRGVDEGVAKQAVADIDRDFQHMHKDWHAWKAGGELVALNAALAHGESRHVSPFVLPLLKEGRDLEAKSGGLFNPAIGGLIEIWGFHSDELPTGKLPDFDKIHALAARHPSMADLKIEDDLVSSTNPTVQFDFGGFAKGVALDMAVAKLKSLGINNAIVNAGGDLNTLGQAGERLWNVGIRDPRDWGVIASVQLMGGENLYTSGNYERFRESEGIRYAHIIDPRTGMPVEHTVSASVIHTDGALADAAATALIVAGPEHWVEVAKAMGVRDVMLVDKQGTVYASPEMLARVVFDTDKKLTIVKSAPLSQQASHTVVQLSDSRQGQMPARH
ncbi:FAD:protein FMN transferase [Magnetovibrio blakemorei]|uniref:FAD:protein FMN transferase n=1 Tax=Magnetovibrio blakemorei TaxID=28181 RepID=A0A1E5Q6F0_9PROT|nr:FAD:protein FMN transferase [Magnetovibrio blakemorei]OEJ66256.1 hypothetical protein BEN30_12770 [Magnetovibrio blakemorei]